jgi:hypothetical protein
MESAMRNVPTQNFDADAGFTRRIDPKAARRQFNMSLGLVVALTVATLGSALTVGAPSVVASREPARLTVQAPQLIHTQQAARTVDGQNGG